MTGTFEFVKDGEQRHSLIQGVPDLATAVVFANAISVYTTANIRRVAHTIASDVNTGERDGEFPVGIFGLSIFRNQEEAIVRLAIPAPDTSFYQLTTRGYELTQAAGQAQAVILGAMTGDTLTFLHGSITGHA